MLRLASAYMSPPSQERKAAESMSAVRALDRNSEDCYSACLLCWPTTNSVVSMILKSSQMDQFST